MDQPKDVITTISHPTTGTVKPIELTLTYYYNAYKVTGIKNSTWYTPGMWLSPSVVQKCCEIPNWTVIITDNEVLATLFGIAKGYLPPLP